MQHKPHCNSCLNYLFIKGLERKQVIEYINQFIIYRKLNSGYFLTIKESFLDL